jgi:hypothetical protein
MSGRILPPRAERGDLMKPPLGLLDVTLAAAIGGLCAHALPDRDRHLA